MIALVWLPDSDALAGTQSVPPSFPIPLEYTEDRV